MVHPARFELATPWFEAKYSDPLSYGCLMRQTEGFSHRSSAKPIRQAGQAHCSFPKIAVNRIANRGDCITDIYFLIADLRSGTITEKVEPSLSLLSISSSASIILTSFLVI